ncbi:MAG: hypothetical protein R2795_11615 [Saprospiraceae bacterium]
MKRSYSWIVWFALLVLAYGLYQYWERQKTGRFEAMLLDFIPSEVRALTVSQSGQPDCELVKNESRWLLSVRHTHETATPSSVDTLLAQLREIRSSQIVGKSAKAWDEYGVSPSEATTICLQFYKDKADVCIHLSQAQPLGDGIHSVLYARLGGLKEVFECRSPHLPVLVSGYHAFRQRCVTDMPPVQPLTLTFQNKDTTLTATRHDSQLWTNGQGDTLSTVAWQPYHQLLRGFCSDVFADDVDELSMDSSWLWSVSYGAHTLSCYRDTTRQQPYIYHSTQFPAVWLAQPSDSLYQILTHPWEKMLEYAQ